MLTVATFNVKDYFRSPETAPVLAAKAAEIARQVARADADLIAFQEVGGEDLVTEALARAPGGHRYEVVFGGADRRGIGNAIASRLPLVEREIVAADPLPFPVFRRGDPPPFGARLSIRRPLVRVMVRALGLAVHVVSAHWKSKLPKPEEDEDGRELRWEGGAGRAEADLRSLVVRAAEALFARRLVERCAERGEVLVMGDLNDTEGSLPVGILRGAGAPHELYGATERLALAARTTTLHRGRGEQIDHVLATAGLHARLVDAHVFSEELREHPLEAPPTVDSDHAMVVARYGEG